MLENTYLGPACVVVGVIDVLLSCHVCTTVRTVIRGTTFTLAPVG